MKNNIIFKGKARTGKSLFADIIFRNEKVLKISGREFDFKEDFLFDNCGEDWNYDYILIDDLRKDFNIEELYKIISAQKMQINRRYEKPIKVKVPAFILIADSDQFVFPDTPTFNRRFTVLDFDNDSISKLTDLILEQKIFILTAVS